jgi:hypothetical protein
LRASFLPIFWPGFLIGKVILPLMAISLGLMASLGRVQASERPRGHSTLRD